MSADGAAAAPGSRAPGTRRREGLLLALVTVVVAAYLLPRLDRDWIPHDEGTLGATAEGVLRGGLPHRDFPDPYTGGLAMLHAAAFALFRVDALATRWTLFLAALAVTPFVWALARRAAPPLAAAGVTLAAVAWGVPGYFAGLPSWYNLFAAIVAAWALCRHHEAGDEPDDDARGRRWLLLAGLAAGASTLFKVTGLALLAAAALAVVGRELTRATARGVGSRRAALAVAVGLGGALTAGLALLVAPQLARQTPGRQATTIVLFVLPGALLAAWLVRRAAGGARIRPATLAGDLAALGAGFLAPVAVFLAPYFAGGGVGALGHLWHGVFVAPRARHAFAAFSPPPLATLLAALPVALLFLLPAGRGGRRWAWAVPAALAVALGGVLAAGGQPVAHQAVWMSLRPLVPLAVVAGLAGRRDDRDFALMAVLALVSLVQFPFASAIYIFYVAPLTVLVLARLARRRPPWARRSLAVVLAFYAAFAVLRVHRGDVATTGVVAVPHANDEPLGLPRATLRVTAAEARLYRALVAAVQGLTRPDEPIWAGPDAPEVAFLAARPSWGGAGFDFLAGASGARDLGARLAGAPVRVVVVQRRPGFSPPLDDATLAALAVAFPRQVEIGPYLVRWRDAGAAAGRRVQ